MERISRFIFRGFFVLGFVGAVASADRAEQNGIHVNLAETTMLSLIQDVRLAQEAEAINSGRWNMDVGNIQEDGLARVEQLLARHDLEDESLTNQ
jgi:hypothetical protein